MSGTTKEHASEQRARTTARVANAIHELREEGSPVTYYSVADRAQVARSTLYRRDDLSAMVNKARDACECRPATERLDRMEREIGRLNERVGTLDSRIPGSSYHCIRL